MKDPKTKLGKRLTQLRKEKGFKSYENFAFENNINRVQYGRYERGDSDIRFTSLVKIVESFDMSLEEFFSEGFD